MDTQTQNSTLPSISQLFKDSWQSLIQSILPLFILNVLGIVLYIGLGLLAVVVFIISGAGSFLLKNGFSNLGTDLLSTPGLIITAIVIFLILIIAYAIIGSALQNTSIILLDSKGKSSLGSAFKKGLSLVLPLFVVNLLLFILMAGGLALLILPALLFFFLLIFAQFEVVLNNQRGLEALKRSVLIVSKNFGGIFVRVLVFFLLYVGIFIIVGIIENSLPEEVQWVVSVITFIPNILLGWFALAYSINLYKQAISSLQQEKGKSMTWMWIVALIGWLIIIGASFLGFKLLSSNTFQQPSAQPITVPKELEVI